MVKKILIPLDGSKLGETALHYVDELITTLSAEQKMEVTLVQVVTRTPQRSSGGEFSGRPLPSTDEEMEPLKNKALAYLNQVAEGLQGKGVNVECKAIIGEMAVSSAETIIQVAVDINADLVAMSSHGRRGLSRWVLGSVTEKVLRAGKTPTLIVRAKE